ncbi:hypothetical protein [Enterocloster hominis (ex Hitch et al. 2024)]|uniref:Uncharacterized protein n=1 Tax=Enterocloster hominis (ex Hitch et al. 2024) TaxID=1917870 RepID=A0ABV1D093_9FIRM
MGGLGWRCGRMLQRHSALLNWQGWASAVASEKGARWCWFLAENGMGFFGMA